MDFVEKFASLSMGRTWFDDDYDYIPLKDRVLRIPNMGNYMFTQFLGNARQFDSIVVITMTNGELSYTCEPKE